MTAVHGEEKAAGTLETDLGRPALCTWSMARLVSALLAASIALVPAEPGPLRGVPLTGPTRLRLLVASDPPLLLDVDKGRVTPVRRLDVRGHPVLSVLAVGKDAVVWLDRRRRTSGIARAEIYVVRRGGSSATRIASGWDIAAARDGGGVWVKSYAGPRQCVLREVGLDGRARRGARPLPCSTRLLSVPGAGGLLAHGSSLIDPRTGRTVLHTGGVWAIAGRFALGRAASPLPLWLTDLRSGMRRRLRWPSTIRFADEAAVQPTGRLIAVDFADPAYGGGGTQVTDTWLLDPASGRFQHLPDMPAAVALKFTSMSWTSDGRVVWLARTGGRDVIAVWRPGRKRIAVRRVRLPARNSGSDSFVVWAA